MSELEERIAIALVKRRLERINFRGDHEAFNAVDLDDARAAIAAMPPQQEWQPIETVPRDGTWFEICRSGEGYDSYEVGRYDPYHRWEYHPIGDGLFRGEEKIVHEWRGFNNMHRATHWRLAPEPPK